ncbi:MAG: 3'-5' exonuclease [Myxococcota bacterium]
MVVLGNHSADGDAAQALQWLAQGAAVYRHAASALPSPLTFVDVETTRDRVVEVAAVRLQRGQWPIAWHTWVNPGEETRHRSDRYWNTSIHGLTAPIVGPSPTFGQVAAPLWQLCADATLVAHNVGFEHRQLVLEYGRLGVVWSRPVLCTLKLSRRLLAGRRGDGGGYTLDELAPVLHVRNPAPHRAMGDVVTSVWVLLALMERFAGRADLAEVLRESARL